MILESFKLAKKLKVTSRRFSAAVGASKQIYMIQYHQEVKKSDRQYIGQPSSSSIYAKGKAGDFLSPAFRYTFAECY